MLDDFAQMAGGKLLLGQATRPQAALASLRRLNCTWLEGHGLICCSGSESDNQALRCIAEKNLLAWLAAFFFAEPRGLPAFDRALMRWIYLSQYSKKSVGP
jgi:hypothetical protein